MRKRKGGGFRGSKLCKHQWDANASMRVEIGMLFPGCKKKREDVNKRFEEAGQASLYTGVCVEVRV